jgi:adenylate kinase
LLVRRMAGRRTCPVCGQIYNVFFSPPRTDGMCDRQCAKLIHRTDDNEEVIRQRLIAYENQTMPLIDYYGKRNVLHHVDGNGHPGSVAEELSRLLRHA